MQIVDWLLRCILHTLRLQKIIIDLCTYSECSSFLLYGFLTGVNSGEILFGSKQKVIHSH